MFNNTDQAVFAVYELVKSKYDLVLTTSFALDEGFTIDCPVIVGKSHGHILELYSDGSLFVLDIMDEVHTQGTHWHPNDVEDAVRDIVAFMEGKSDYELFPLPGYTGA